MTERYEVENPEVKATLKDIAAKIGAAHPAGWGFLLHLFSFGEKGSTFYISNAERKDAISMLREWIAKAEGEDEMRAAAVNPDHPVTLKVQNQWHKIVALLLIKMGADSPDEKLHQVITAEDVAALERKEIAVAVKDAPDGLHVFVVDAAEAERLAAEGKAVEGRTL